MGLVLAVHLDTLLAGVAHFPAPAGSLLPVSLGHEKIIKPSYTQPPRKSLHKPQTLNTPTPTPSTLILSQTPTWEFPKIGAPSIVL